MLCSFPGGPGVPRERRGGICSQPVMPAPGSTTSKVALRPNLSLRANVILEGHSLHPYNLQEYSRLFTHHEVPTSPRGSLRDLEIRSEQWVNSHIHTCGGPGFAFP